MKKKAYPENFKTLYGLCTLNWTETISNTFMTSLFMIYMTDYSGIGAFAPVLVTALLAGGRIFDAINDPLQGFIMDRKKPGRYGKYKPFIFFSILLVTVALIALFAIPQGLMRSNVLITIWVVVFYLLFDIGASFFAEGPLRQSLTTNPVLRARFTTWPRVVSMIIVIPITFFIPMTVAFNKSINNMGMSFSLLAVIFLLGAGVFSLFGLLMVKEGKHPVTEEKVKFIEILRMFKTNKPLIVNSILTVFHGFVWTLVFATTTYYIRWAYSADLTTGVIDQERFGSLTMILGIFQLMPSLFMAAISPKLVKMFGPVRVFRFAILLELIGSLGLFIFMVTGILDTSPILFFAAMSVLVIGIGLTFVPGSMIGMECADYGLYITGGKVMYGSLNAIGRFIAKMQTGFSAALIGGVLILIGYEVDSVTDTFLGDLARIPQMLNYFIIISGLIPAVLCVISLIALRFYPIDDKLRNEMNTAIEKLKSENPEGE